MTEPTRKKAEMLLIVVGSVAASVVVAAAALWLVATMLGMEPIATVEWLIGIAAAVSGGALGFKVWSDKGSD